MFGNAKTERLLGLITRAVEQGVTLCESLERGQSEMPLQEHFGRISERLETAPFALILLGLTPEARGAALSWLCGHENHVLSIHVPREVGLVEVQLQGQGYVLEQSDGSRQEFDRLESFLKALEKADLVRPGDAGSWVDPLRLRMAAPLGAQGLLVAMPENVQAVMASPSHLTRLMGASNVLLVAAPEGHVLTGEDEAAIRELLGGVDAVWPVITGPGDGLPEGTPGWWQRIGVRPPGVQLPVERIVEGVERKLPVWLTNPDEPVRQLLFLGLYARQLQAAAEMISDRHSQDLRQLSNRNAVLMREVKGGEEKGWERDVKAQLDGCRGHFQGVLSEVQSGIADMGRKSLMPMGDLAKRVRESIERLDEGDFLSEPMTTTVRLSLRGSFLSALEEELRRGVRQQFGEELTVLRDAVTHLRQELETRLGTIRGVPVHADLRLPNEGELWTLLNEMIRVDLRYRGELPKHTWWRIVSEARGQAIMAIMLLTIFSGVFKLLDMKVDRSSTPIAMLMLAIFIGSLLYVPQVLGKQKKDLMEKEVERVKQQLNTELSRLLSDLQREKMSRLGAFFSSLQKDAARVVDQVSAETVAWRAEEQDVRQRELRGKMRTVDKRLKDLTVCGRDVAELRKVCAEAMNQYRKDLHDASLAWSRPL